MVSENYISLGFDIRLRLSIFDFVFGPKPPGTQVPPLLGYKINNTLKNKLENTRWATTYV